MACGGTMVGVGIWAFVEKNKFFYQPIQDIYDIIFDLSIILMVAGGIMFIITMCGFVGALRENTCLLKFFYITLMFIFLLEVVAGILAFAFKDKVIDTLSGVLKEVYIEGYQNDEEAVMDFFQENFDCCGVKSYEDWNINEYYNCSEANPSALKCAVPYSCCKDPDELTPGLNNILCGGNALYSNYTDFKVWTSGCVDRVMYIAEKNLPIIGAVAIAIAVPQIIGIVLGYIFVGQIEHQRVRYKAYMNRRRYRDEWDERDRHRY
ncbi:tetraspanin-33-like isoform X2 [Mercenaria mercenaria]|uniref:tetraspanin-33-like isoform X2 n=1 Tax=Mercenaria mercenaria TaxID=6596 RepID=UPI00234FACF2|nr:tetraspanin-33-like isoform X2 [Mercenaria mercenaria]